MAEQRLRKGGRRTAEHEAAHAVIGILTGLQVDRVTIAPRQLDRERGLAGVCYVYPHGDQAWPIPRAPMAEIYTYAAGYAWENRVAGWDLRRDPPELDGYHDRLSWPADAFLEAVEDVARILGDPVVRLAVELVADELQSRKAGWVRGSTVERALIHSGGLRVRSCPRCGGSGTAVIPRSDGVACPCWTCGGKGIRAALVDDGDQEVAA